MKIRSLCKIFIKTIALVLSCSAIYSCSPQLQWLEYKLTGSAMGTQWNITIVDNNVNFDYLAIKREIIQELDSIENIMSHYRPRSELSQINSYPAGGWYSISPKLYEVLELSRNISEKTFGAFDVTLGGLVNEWGFGNTKNSIEQLPDTKKLKALLAETGWHRYHLEYDAGLPRFGKTSDFKLDLSAVAKGYAVDDIAKLLKAKGIENYLVDIGGEIKVSGYNVNKEEWVIAVEKPQAGSINTVQQLIKLTNKSIATSGNYRNFQKIEGKNYAHIINNRNGKPSTNSVLSATVISNSTAKADAWATALMNMSPKAGLAFANIENLPIMLVVRTPDNTEKTMMSKLFNLYLIENP